MPLLSESSSAPWQKRWWVRAAFGGASWRLCYYCKFIQSQPFTGTTFSVAFWVNMNRNGNNKNLELYQSASISRISTVLGIYVYIYTIYPWWFHQMWEICSSNVAHILQFWWVKLNKSLKPRPGYTSIPGCQRSSYHCRLSSYKFYGEPTYCL